MKKVEIGNLALYSLEILFGRAINGNCFAVGESLLARLEEMRRY
jgi:hypothetical protein